MARGVGVIGASPRRGWAGRTHVPAIRAVPELRLAAVATSDEATAGAAADEWGVQGYADPLALIADPAIEIVVVAVKAPDHAPLVEAALRARKPVLCEWPLGRSLAETARLAELARTLEVPTAIGLQGRVSPWVAGVRRRLAEGWVGEVRSVSLMAWDLLSTGTITAGNAYMLDPDNGATPLSIVGGHTLDTLFHMVGEPTSLSAVTTTSVPWVSVDGASRVAARSPDQIVLAGTLRGGAALSVHIRAGEAEDEAVRLEIGGSEGFLRVVVREGYIHWGPFDVSVRRGGERLASWALPHDGVDPDLAVDLGVAHNVAYLHRAFARALDGQGRVADFADALARHHLIERIAQGTQPDVGTRAARSMSVE